MRRADRLFRIVLRLNTRRAVTARELAEELEVSERTIYRDIADLSISGVPVEGAAGVGYLLRGHHHIPPMMFDGEELAALQLGARMVQGWTDPGLGAAAERALLKIEAVLPSARRAGLEHTPLHVPDFHVPPTMLAPITLLRHAIAENRKIDFHYTRADGTASQRRVWPLGLFFWGGSWTLGAWCEWRETYRTFRLDRIRSPEAAPERFPNPGLGLLQDYIRAVSEPADSLPATPEM